MNRYEMVVIIVAIVMFATVLKAIYASKYKPKATADNAEAERLKEEVRALRERIHVLERIAVEKESTLEREIEQLRDR